MASEGLAPPPVLLKVIGPESVLFPVSVSVALPLRLMGAVVAIATFPMVTAALLMVRVPGMTVTPAAAPVVLTVTWLMIVAPE